MANIDDNFIEEVKSKNEIVDLISSYLDLRRYNDTYKALCPFHGEKTPSFIVNERNQFFHCFGCGESGDVISFVMKKENMDFMEALKYLADRANITWPQGELNVEQKENIKRKESLIRLHTDIARFYFSTLWSNREHALNYLRKRGLQDRTIKKFGLGYASGDNTLLSFLFKKGYSKETIQESGLFIERNGELKERFFSRIIFPIFDIRGRVIAFGGRVINEGHPKYLNSPETIIFHKKENLYGLNLAKSSSVSELILVEGYMDVISLCEHGFWGAIASLGTALSKEQVEKLKKYAKKIYIAYDSDDAGKKATLRAIDIFREQGISPYIVNMEDSKDPDEFIKKHHATSFRRLMDEARTSLQFTNDCIRDKYNLDSDSHQIEFIKEVTGILKKSKNAVEVEKEILRLSKLTGISVKALGTEVYGMYFSPKQFKNSLDIDQKFQKITPEHIPVHAQDHFSLEMSILYNLYINSNWRKKIFSLLSEDDFSNEMTKEIFRQIQNKVEVIKVFEGNNFVYKIFDEEQFLTIVRRLQKASIQNKISELQTLQAGIDTSNPDHYRKSLEIGMKITFLNKKIKNL